MLAGSWTALVSPGIAARTWTTPWSAVFAAIYVLTMLTVSPPVMLLRFSTNVLLLQLSQRVDRRAMKAALRAVLEHHRASTDPDAPAPPASPGRAAYMDLHASFSAVWRRRVLQSNVSAPVIFATLVHLLMLVVNAAACSCLPAAYIIYIGYIGMMNLIDLVNVAAANAQVSDVRSLYLDTVREIREMQRESPPSSSAGARWAMDRDAAVLSSYVASDMHRARLFGLVVTYGVVRTVLVTVLTLLVALWSVMRGLGLVLTMETIWPTV
ncbi:hypothetical protein DFJ74DRAFT_660130 [Hyaloraphidium curvatum]|nr:hypothetical protein DFJ74DRAFT_660130 [Hyaloraphidium curvatum]